MGFTAFALPLILLTALVEQVAADEPIALSSVLKKYASKQHRTSAADARASPNARTFVAELTPVDFGRFGWETWQMNIGLGTPVQHLNVTITYGTVNMFVFSKGYAEKTCRGPAGSRNTFSLNDTTTIHYEYAEEELLMAEPYADANDCGTLNATGFSEGSLYYDNVTIGGESLPQVSFYSMDTAQHFNPQWASDGLLGLDFAYDCIFNDWGIDWGCTMIDIVSDLMGPRNDTKSAVVSIYLPSSDAVDANGLITFGSLRNQKCSTNWRFVPKYISLDNGGSYPGWNVQVTGFSLGSYSTGKISQIGGILSESAFIWAPKNSFNGIISALRAKFSYKLKQYVVPCSKVASLPDMVFALNGTSKSVSAQEYTRQAPGDAKTCVLLLQDVSIAHGQFGSLLLPPMYGMNNYWVLGSSFLRGSCHALDFGNQFFENLPDFPALFGFAPAA